MGACLSSISEVIPFVPKDAIPEIGPSMNSVRSFVSEYGVDLAKDFYDFYKEYKNGMEENAPRMYVCKEVPMSEEGGYLTLTKGVDDDRKVRNGALAAACGEAFRNKAKDEVWERVQPEVEGNAESIGNEYTKKAAVKVARKSCDVLVDSAVDELVKGMATTLDPTEISESAESELAETSERMQVAITAPPGKLGVILVETADGGGTYVSDIRATSPLFGRLLPGDGVISVNGRDVSSMSLGETMDVFAQTAAEERILVIIRFGPGATPMAAC